MPAPALPIAVAWTCGSNTDHQDTFSASLALRNVGPGAIAPGWSIYFNACRKIIPGSVTAGFAIDHVNGDLFRVTSASTAPWLCGEALGIDYQGQYWAISATDAPLGFYLVDADGVVIDLGDPAIAPFATAQQRHRGPQDAIPLDDAASRYAQNAALHRLPRNAVGRITPQPVTASFDGGSCRVGRATQVLEAAGLENEAALLRAILDQLPDTAGAIACVTLALVPGMPDEGYALTIDADGIRIDAASVQGVFYGIQSLRQLQDGAHLPTGQVGDAPRFAYRGMMLDVARHFAGKETVLRLLDCMALYKLNRFHFHLTDDEGWRFPVPALPELTAIGARRGVSVDGSPCLPPSFGSGADVEMSAGTGCYSAADFIDILRHAQSLHIEVIPEFNLPGHARAAIVAMRARCERLQGDPDAAAYLLDDAADRSVYESVQLWHDNVVCIALPSVDRFIDTVVAALVDLFRGAGVQLRTIHIGGDEVPSGAWTGSPACQALMAQHNWDVDALRADFLARCLAILARYGVACAGWDETAMERQQPNPRFAASGLQVYAWNNAPGGGQEDIACRLANAGYPVVLANAASLYFDLAQAKHPCEPGYYWAGFVSTRDAFVFDPPGAARIDGLQGQLWGENSRTPARIEYMAAPRLIALAERAWSPDPQWHDDAAAACDWNAFANRLGQRVLPQLDAGMAYGYRLPPPGVAVVKGAVHANVALPGLALHYTVDGTEPTAASPRYAQPVAAGGVRIAAFDTRGRRGRIVHIDQQGTIHD